MLHLDHLSKTFNAGTVNRRLALDNISLHLKPGDFVTVIGGNGAGKSTMLGAIAGIFLADAGRIVLGGEDITFLPEYKRSRRMGRLFQDPMRGTAPNMTIAENLSLAYQRSSGLRLGLGLNQKSLAMFRERLAQLELGLEDRMKTNVGLLSGGQRQAVTLLMATIVTPKLLMLDEHTAALDPATAEKVLRMTTEIVARDNITTLMITHNISSALKLGNRTIMMDEGRIILDISGRERADMTVETLLERFRQCSAKELDNDRILLQRDSRP